MEDYENVGHEDNTEVFFIYAQTCGDSGCVGARLLWLCIEDSISLSESSLPERVDITLLVIYPGPIE